MYNYTCTITVYLDNWLQSTYTTTPQYFVEQEDHMIPSKETRDMENQPNQNNTKLTTNNYLWHNSTY